MNNWKSVPGLPLDFGGQCNVVLLNGDCGRQRLNKTEPVNLATQSDNCVISRGNYKHSLLVLNIMVLNQSAINMNFIGKKIKPPVKAGGFYLNL